MRSTNVEVDQLAIEIGTATLSLVPPKPPSPPAPETHNSNTDRYTCSPFKQPSHSSLHPYQLIIDLARTLIHHHSLLRTATATAHNLSTLRLAHADATEDCLAAERQHRHDRLAAFARHAPTACTRDFLAECAFGWMEKGGMGKELGELGVEVGGLEGEVGECGTVVKETKARVEGLGNENGGLKERIQANKEELSELKSQVDHERNLDRE